jgi:lipoyl(octanoyl) transferase
VSDELTFKSLGTANYLETLDGMKTHLMSDTFQNEIWMLEHPPVFTLGTAADNQHVLDARDIPVIQSDRGGEVTYHGPRAASNLFYD